MGLTRTQWIRSVKRLQKTVHCALDIARTKRHTKVYNKLRRINKCRPGGKHRRRCRVTSYCLPCMNVYMKRLAKQMADYLRETGDEKHFVYRRKEIIWLNKWHLNYEDMRTRLIPLLIKNKEKLLRSFNRSDMGLIGASSKLELVANILEKNKVGLCMTTMLVFPKIEVYSLSKYWEEYLYFDTPRVLSHGARIEYVGQYSNEKEAKKRIRQCFPNRVATTVRLGPEILEGFLYASFDRDLWKSCGQLFNASNTGRAYRGRKAYHKTEQERKRQKIREKQKRTNYS